MCRSSWPTAPLLSVLQGFGLYANQKGKSCLAHTCTSRMALTSGSENSLTTEPATLSPRMLKAAQQASVMTPSLNPLSANSQSPVLTMSTESFSPFDLNKLIEPTIAPDNLESVVKAQAVVHVTSPTLEEILQKSTFNALEYIDTTAYPNRLFRI